MSRLHIVVYVRNMDFQNSVLTPAVLISKMVIADVSCTGNGKSLNEMAYLSESLERVAIVYVCKSNLNIFLMFIQNHQTKVKYNFFLSFYKYLYIKHGLKVIKKKNAV